MIKIYSCYERYSYNYPRSLKPTVYITKIIHEMAINPRGKEIKLGISIQFLKNQTKT